MKILAVAQESDLPNPGVFITSITLIYSPEEGADETCTVDIYHTRARQIVKHIIHPSFSSFRITKGQAQVILEKGIEHLRKEQKYAGIEITEEDKEMCWLMTEAILRKIHLHYDHDQKFQAEVRDPEDLYKELKYILKNN